MKTYRIQSTPMIHTPGVFRWIMEAVKPFQPRKARELFESLVRSYDSTTESEAEDSREFYRKDQVERDIEENRETLKSLRHEIRQLAHELKTLCPSHLVSEYPATRKGVISCLRGLLADRREIMETNSKLAASL